MSILYFQDRTFSGSRDFMISLSVSQWVLAFLYRGEEEEYVVEVLFTRVLVCDVVNINNVRSIGKVI